MCSRWSLISVKDLRVNDRIRVREVRLIGEEGEQFGIVPTFEALKTAQERGLDLVEVAPTAVPPVCRLMDYGRFKYEQTKKEREARKNQKVVELKEVRMTPRTDEHDILAKVKKIQGFLEEGDKVKVTIRFRGRELAHPQLGRQVLEQVTENVKNGAVIERPPMFEGRSMFMILAPPGSRPQGQPRPAPEAAAPDQPVPAGVGPRPATPAPNGPAPSARAPSAGTAPHPRSAPTRPPAAEQPAPGARPQPASSAPPPGPPRPGS